MGDALIQYKGTIYEKGYGQVGKAVMQDQALKKSAKLIYAYLCTFGSGAFPSRNKICTDLKIGKTTLTDSIKELIINGYLSVKQQRSEQGHFSHNVYIIEFIKR
jgi:hypothetical protein